MINSNPAYDFFITTVKPTVEEALVNHWNIRLARLAAIVLCHMIDHWALRETKSQNRNELDDLVKIAKTEMRQKIPSYSLIIDVADASKHARLALPKTGSRNIYNSEDVKATPGLFSAPFGQGHFREACIIYVTLEDGTKANIIKPLREILAEWERIFNELKK